MASAASDPLQGFFENGTTDYLTANCYAYALNLAVGPLNPGRTGNGPLAAYNDSLKLFQEATAADGLLYLGDDEDAVPATVTGTNIDGYQVLEADYLVILGRSIADYHWQRIDSKGLWSEKFPNKFAVHTGNNANLAGGSSKSIHFTAWFLVRNALVQERAAAWRKTGAKTSGAGSRKCVIL